MNLTEAFQALDSLNEDTFSVDTEGIKKLQDFVINDDSVDELSVFDLDAEDDEAAAKNCHDGDLILNCSVCHSDIYKPADDVVVDDETGLACTGMECPYCFSTDGYKIRPFKVVEVSEDEMEDIVSDADEDNEEDDSLSENFNVGDEIKKYQKWVDYDMKRYGKISDKTKQEIKKAGLQLIKDQYGDYEISAGSYKAECLNETNTVSDIKKEAIIDWLSEHDQAFEDAKSYFNSEDLSEVDENKIIDWIQDHGQLSKDFDSFFDVECLDEAVELSTVKGTLGNVLDTHKDELNKITNSKELVAFLERIKPEVSKSQHDYLNSVITDVKKLPDIKALQYMYNIILKGDGHSSKEDKNKQPLLASFNESFVIEDNGGEYVYAYNDRNEDFEVGLDFGFYTPEDDPELQEILFSNSSALDKYQQLADGGYLTASEREYIKKLPKTARAALVKAIINTSKEYGFGEDLTESFNEIEIKANDVEIEISSREKESEESEAVASEDVDESCKRKSIKEDMSKFDVNIPGFKSEIVDTFEDEGYIGHMVVFSKNGVDIVNAEIWEDPTAPIMIEDNLYAPNLMNRIYDSFESFAEDLTMKARNIAESKRSLKRRSIKEDVEEIEIKSNDMNIKIEPAEEEECDTCSKEMVKSLSDEEKEEIELNVDSVDKETFNEIGESFLKENYSNVKFFRTGKIIQRNNKFLVEGIIGFKNGKKKLTQFAFKPQFIKNGKVRLLGENFDISSKHKSLSLTGKVRRGTLISESLRRHK